MDERFYTPKQVAEILQVHQYTVLKWIREGKLRALKFGRVYRTRESELGVFLGQTAHDSAQDIMRSAADGPVVQESTVHYVPPHVAIPMPASSPPDRQSDQEVYRLTPELAPQLEAAAPQSVYSIRMDTTP